MDVYEVHVEQRFVYIIAASDAANAERIGIQVANGTVEPKMALTLRKETKVILSQPYRGKPGA